MALQVWLPLNGNLNNQGLASDLTLTSGTATYKAGKIGQGLNLNSRVTFNCPSLSGLTKFSVAFWAKVEDNSSITSNWQDIIGFTDQKADNSATGQLRAESCYASANVPSGAGIHWHDNTTYSIVNGANFPNHYSGDRGVWHHCTLTVDSSVGCVVYTDGAQVGTVGNPNGGHITGVFWLGETNNIAGCINDVRIYDHVLSPREVAEIAKGLVLHYPLNRDGFGNDNFYSATGIGPCGAGITSYTNDGYEHHSVWNKGGTARAQSLGFNGKTGPWTVSFDVKASVNCSIFVDVCDKAYATSAYGNDLVANKWTHKSYTITTATNQYNTSGNYNGFVDFNLSGSAIVEGTTLDIKNLHVEEGTVETPFIPASGTTLHTAMGLNGTTVYDTSGFGNNGTITGTLSYSGDTPRYNASTQIDGSTITCASGLVSVADPVFSVSLWFRLKSNTSYTCYQDLINFASPSYSNQPFRLEICGSPVGNDIYWFRGPTGSTGGFKVNNTALSRDVWYHTVLVSEGNKQYSYYMNGVKQGTYNGSANTWTPTGSVRIGDSIAGKIDISDFRIYATALTADQVKQLYEAPISLANNGTLFAYEFNET